MGKHNGKARSTGIKVGQALARKVQQVGAAASTAAWPRRRLGPALLPPTLRRSICTAPAC
jgi:hypothetical protein